MDFDKLEPGDRLSDGGRASLWRWRLEEGAHLARLARNEESSRHVLELGGGTTGLIMTGELLSLVSPWFRRIMRQGHLSKRKPRCKGSGLRAWSNGRSAARSTGRCLRCLSHRPEEA